MLKTFVVLAIAVLLSAVGHVLLSKGMKEVGDVSQQTVQTVGSMLLRVITNKTLLLGVALQAVFFSLYLGVLSWEDLSFVLPLTAADYVVIAVLAHFFLAEAIPMTRWAGTLFVTIGVMLITRS